MIDVQRQHPLDTAWCLYARVQWVHVSFSKPWGLTGRGGRLNARNPSVPPHRPSVSRRCLPSLSSPPRMPRSAAAPWRQSCAACRAGETPSSMKTPPSRTRYGPWRGHGVTDVDRFTRALDRSHSSGKKEHTSSCTPRARRYCCLSWWCDPCGQAAELVAVRQSLDSSETHRRDLQSQVSTLQAKLDATKGAELVALAKLATATEERDRAAAQLQTLSTTWVSGSWQCTLGIALRSCCGTFCGRHVDGVHSRNGPSARHTMECVCCVFVLR